MSRYLTTTGKYKIAQLMLGSKEALTTSMIHQRLTDGHHYMDAKSVQVTVSLMAGEGLAKRESGIVCECCGRKTSRYKLTDQAKILFYEGVA